MRVWVNVYRNRNTGEIWNGCKCKQWANAYELAIATNKLGVSTLIGRFSYELNE